MTAENMPRILATLAELLDGYEIREIPMEDAGRDDDLLEYYLGAMRVEGRSPKTIERYRYVIQRMLKDVGIPCRRITIYHLRNWLSKEQERGVADSTLEGIRQVFSAFF